jgi:type I site-specific restriction endonuclease
MSQEHTDALRDDLFGEVISTYTDEDALDDGVLVDLLVDPASLAHSDRAPSRARAAPHP